MSVATLGWLGIVRFGSSADGPWVDHSADDLDMNRVMVVEFALPAMLPGALFALYHVIQMTRPRFGLWLRCRWPANALDHRRDAGSGGRWYRRVDRDGFNGNRTSPGYGSRLLGFVMIGLGVGACGTSLLVFLAKRVEPSRRAAAATIVWVMMIAGFAITAGIAGHFLDPFSPQRLVLVTSCVALTAILITLLSVHNLEGKTPLSATLESAKPVEKPPFRVALAEVWREPDARRFTIFVFVSMLAYSAQDLILEPSLAWCSV